MPPETQDIQDMVSSLNRRKYISTGSQVIILWMFWADKDAKQATRSPEPAQVNPIWVSYYVARAVANLNYIEDKEPTHLKSYKGYMRKKLAES